MSGGPKRNPDRLNTLGVVVIGVCGAVLVYVTIVFLEAFYVNDTSDVQTMADYGGQDTTAKSLKASQLGNINEAASNQVAPGAPQTYRIPIDTGDRSAIKLVIESAKTDPSHLVPAMPPAIKHTIDPIFGKPKLGGPTGAATGSAAPPACDEVSCTLDNYEGACCAALRAASAARMGSDAGSAAGSGAAGSAAGSGAGSAAPAGAPHAGSAAPAGAPHAGSAAPAGAPRAGSAAGSGGHAP